MSASAVAVAAAEKALGCERTAAFGRGLDMCEYHGRLTDRGCPIAVAVADAVAVIAAKEALEAAAVDYYYAHDSSGHVRRWLNDRAETGS